jgi:hypothetical protein
VNSTEEGGGVAKMLHFLLGYLAGAGIDTHWMVLEGNEEFFEVAKRLHHLLHGRPGDGRGMDQTVRGSTSRPRKRRSQSCSDGSALATSWFCTTHRPLGLPRS